MEYAVPAILFVAGFGAALLARRAGAWARWRGGSNDMPLEKGVVRLDQVAKKDKRHRAG